MLTPTTLPALSDYSLRSQHTRPDGSDTQRLITPILSAFPHRCLYARYSTLAPLSLCQSTQSRTLVQRGHTWW